MIDKEKEVIITQTLKAPGGSIHWISAGPGTGKTELLKGLVKRYLKVKPKANILFLGTAKKTINVGMERLDSSVEFLNFHQFGYRLIRQNAGVVVKTEALLGYPNEFTLPKRNIFRLQEPDVKKLLKEFEREHGIEDSSYDQVFSYLNRWLVSKSRETDFRSGPKLEEVLTKYNKWKLSNKMVDFNDMILLPWLYYKENPLKVSEYDLILVDELQDMNLYQAELLISIRGRARVVLVGDPCQLAYSFLGASHRIYYWMQKQYKRDFHWYSLEKSYRCPRYICDLSNRITSEIAVESKTKISSKSNTYSEHKASQVYLHRGHLSGVQWIVDKIESLSCHGSSEEYGYSNFVILFRAIRGGGSGQQAFHALEKELTKRKIPITYRDRFEDAVVRYEKMLSVLRVAIRRHSKEDLAITLSLLNGIALFRATEMTTDWEAVKHKNAKEFIRKLQRNSGDWGAVVKNVSEVLDEHLGRFNLKLPKFFSKFESYEDAELNWESRLRNKVANRNSVTLSTIHGFKGDERKIVFIVGVDCLSFPFLEHTFRNETDDEDRCLLNIAITRTQEQLYMTCLERGARGEQSLSPYLFPLIRENLIEVIRDRPMFKRPASWSRSISKKPKNDQNAESAV